ncbi:hypothetical protein E2I00_005955, partial [Balaenoptera physalus]
PLAVHSVCIGGAWGDKQGPFKSQYPYLDENSLQGLLKYSHYPEEEEKQTGWSQDWKVWWSRRSGMATGRGQGRTLGRGGVAGGKDLRTSGKVPGGEDASGAPCAALPSPGQMGQPTVAHAAGRVHAEPPLPLSGGQRRAQTEFVLMCVVEKGTKTPERGYGGFAGLTDTGLLLHGLPVVRDLEVLTPMGVCPLARMSLLRDNFTVPTCTCWGAPIIWDGTFDPDVAQQEAVQQNLTIGLTVFAVG